MTLETSRNLTLFPSCHASRSEKEGVRERERMTSYPINSRGKFGGEFVGGFLFALEVVC